MEEVMRIKQYIEDSIAEMESYAEDPTYDDCEQHDCRVAAEAYEQILSFVNKIISC